MCLVYKEQIPEATEFFNLFNTTGWNEEYHLTVNELMTAVQNSRHVISVYCADRLVGFGRVVSDGIVHAMIYDLIVDPGFQGQGIGTQVLQRLVAFCKKAGIRDIQLFSAKGKRAFYEHRNFRCRSEEAPGMEYVTG